MGHPTIYKLNSKFLMRVEFEAFIRFLKAFPDDCGFNGSHRVKLQKIEGSARNA